MCPQFATPIDRAQVELLMQPALIRVIDNIRKQLDETDWQGAYEEKMIWPAGTTELQQQEYAALQKQLHGVPTEEHDRVAALMANLPQPSPIYTLRLKKAHHPDQTVDIWALCYQVCAANEASLRDAAELPLPEFQMPEVITADTGLLDESGEVDWQLLDDKTRALVEGIFRALSDAPAE
jgi:hypothetical protein